MQENTILAEILPYEQEKFVIDNDNKAEWALERIRAEKEDMERLIKVCEDRIAEYQAKIEQFKKQYENRTAYLKSLLAQYFERVPHKKTKTQESYQLPSGRLILKYPGPEFQRDNDALVRWLESRNYTDFIEVKKSPKWAELKKLTVIAGDKVIERDTGEIIEGIKVIERPPEFIVEV